MQAIMRIELLSDCLPGDGAGSGAYIDTDCVFDRYGFPVIPSKRLKGCLREAAGKLLAMGCSERDAAGVEALFGDAQHEGTLRMENAQLEGVAALHAGIEYYNDIRKRDEQFLFMPDMIQALYTTLRTRTAIDERGVAKDKSLRTSRVIRKGNVFTCRVEFPDEDFRFVSCCALMLRRIGMNRSRGLGEVDISLRRAAPDQGAQRDEESMSGAHEIQDALEVVLRLTSPVIVGEAYIPGVMVRGALAANYMRAHDAPPSGDYRDDPTFASMLLDGVTFGPGMPTDDANRRYHAMPASVVRRKVAREGEPLYTDLAAAAPPTDTQMKSVQAGMYCAPCEEDGRMYVMQAAREQRMHHAMDGSLFNYEAISSGSRFLMKITGKRDGLRALAAFMREMPSIRIGKSRNTQYGGVVIESVRAIAADEGRVRSCSFALTMETPVILMDEQGTYTPQGDALLAALEERTGKALALNRLFAVHAKAEGYNPQWRLSKPPIPVLGERTTILFESEQEVELPREVWLGERNGEGYGLGRVTTIAERELCPRFDASKPRMRRLSAPDGEEWRAFVKRFERTHLMHRLQIDALNHPANTREIPIGDDGYRWKTYNMNTRTLQSLYALVLQCRSWRELSESIGNIRMVDKKKGCSRLCVDTLHQCQQSIDEIVKERTCPPLSPIESENLSWDVTQFYLSEIFRNSIVNLMRKRRGGAGKGGAE